MSRPWMPLYVADYLKDTGHLSPAEHGAYMLLIMHYWANEKLPQDDRQLARIARMSDREWKSARQSVAPLFRSDWTHKRIEGELAKAAEKSAAARANGSRGAKSKWGWSDAGSKRSERLAAAREQGRHTKEEWSAMLRAIPQCVKCGADEQIVKDHIVPIYQGGSDAIENIQPLCHSCNSAKGPDTTDLRPIDWRVKMASEMRGERLANASHRAGVSPSQSQDSSTELSPAALEREFGIFYAAYPKKVGPKDARNSFFRAVKSGVSPDRIIAAATRFRDAHASAGTEKQFIPAPAVWLNKGRYDDEDLPQIARAGPPRRPELTGFHAVLDQVTNGKYHENPDDSASVFSPDAGLRDAPDAAGEPFGNASGGKVLDLRPIRSERG